MIPSLLANVNWGAFLLSVTVALFVAGGLFTLLLFLGSRLGPNNRTNGFYDNLRKSSLKNINRWQKEWKVEWFDNLEMWLMIIGDGLKPKYDPFSFLVTSVALGVFCFIYFLKVTASFILAGVTGIVGFIFPIIIIYISFLSVASDTRKVFLPFVDGYTQTYLDYNRVVTLAFKELGDRCPEEMRSVVNYLNLCIADSTEPFEKSMNKFAEILNFGWAHDFAAIIISGKTGEYKQIEGALNNLSLSLWAAKSVDLDRNATIKVVFALMTILAIFALGLMQLNMSLLPESKQIYFATPEGINFITISIVILVVSFIGALIWAKKGDRL
ncbi:hypothetical protein POF51_26305 [Brevibacillus sp. AG]|uniref:hypothetical protein n=1 Tax=Brevibacillus sp. AG TaxID=3020891 RepID=UPI00233156C9|nr:hypothetical protein [Brevibacillus sp. AG]MDC0764236.1 hypothetical protein [Brevibacillus sp. AG]